MGKPGCGACHPGGGGMELDRDGERYDKRLTADPELAKSLDGDYYKSKWDKTGVVEADCFLCHLAEYDFKTRVKQLKFWNFKWASLASSGVGVVKGKVQEGNTPTVAYNKRLFNADGKLAVEISHQPESENCVFCHGFSDRKKRGFSWNDPFNHDVHNMRGIGCIECHPGDMAHNFAKGDERVSTVRDDLDGTMKTCEQCHMEGSMGAPRPAHTAIRPNHLKRMDCEACHIPSLHVAGGAGFDVTTGGLALFPTIGAKKVGAKFDWQPRLLRGKDGKLEPVNPLLAIFYTNMDADGIYKPLFAKELKKAWATIKDQFKDRPKNRPVLQTKEDIGIMLSALNESLANNQRFKAVAPHLHRGGDVYSLDASGNVNVEDDHTWAGHLEAFNINHNVAPAKQALGANGCDDCHSEEAHIFKGLVPVNLMTEDGEVKYVKNGRLIGCRPWAFALNMFHQQYLTPYVSLLIFLIAFFIIIHYTGRGPKMIDYGGKPTIQRFNLTERWTHMVRMLSFLLLWLTGAIFFYNARGLMDVFFNSFDQVVLYHVVGGIIFLVASFISLGLWVKDARWEPCDSEWLKKSGGYLDKNEEEIPAGRLNAGQKIFFWLSFILTLLIGATGIALMFKSSLPLTTICAMSTVHGFLAIVFIATILAHAYLGTIANPGTWQALISGKVSSEWAQKHHSEWFKKIT